VGTKTQRFGAGSRESHDSSPYYARNLWSAEVSTEATIEASAIRDVVVERSAEVMEDLRDNCVALMVTSPPYHVGKDYDGSGTLDDYLDFLERVFTEVHRVLQPGGRAVVNVANLGRRPYIPLSHLVTARMLAIGFHMRAEVIWRKAKGASSNCAWGSWRSATNPVVRDVHEYCLCFSKGRFDRVARGTSTIPAEDFMDATLSVWDIPAESATRVGHPAPFPVELPQRFIELYTFAGELVLDPFLGSGSTAVAAVRSGRHYVGYEIDADYAAAARRRIAEEVARRPKPWPRPTADARSGP
jgi:site-specific DNA-methyltransferase (adenine-specific)